MKSVFCLLCLSVFLLPRLASAVETVRTSDREIVERLTRIETEIQIVRESIDQLREDTF